MRKGALLLITVLLVGALFAAAAAASTSGAITATAARQASRDLAVHDRFHGVTIGRCEGGRRAECAVSFDDWVGASPPFVESRYFTRSIVSRRGSQLCAQWAYDRTGYTLRCFTVAQTLSP